MPRLHSRRAMRRRQEACAYQGLYRFEPLRFGSYTGRTDGGGFCGGLCPTPMSFWPTIRSADEGCASFTLFSLKTAVPSRTPTLPIGRRSGSTRRATDRVTNFSPASPGWNTTAVARIPNGSAVRLMIRTPITIRKPWRSRSAAACSLRETGSAERTEGETGTLYRNGGQGGRGVRKTAGGRRNPL